MERGPEIPKLPEVSQPPLSAIEQYIANAKARRETEDRDPTLKPPSIPQRIRAFLTPLLRKFK